MFDTGSYSRVGRAVLAGLLLGTISFSLTAVQANPVSMTTTLETEKTEGTLVLAETAALRGMRLGGTAVVHQKGADHYKMTCGCALITSAQPVRVDTCRVQVFARENTTFVLDAEENVSRVLNLSDRKRDSLKVIVGKRQIILNPGEEMAVTDHIVKERAELAPTANIKYRRPQLFNSDDRSILVFEFSLADALKECVIFKKLKDSSSDADQKLLQEIVKTAAAVNTMFSKSREKYSDDGTDPDAKNKAVARKGTSS